MTFGFEQPRFQSTFYIYLPTLSLNQTIGKSKKRQFVELVKLFILNFLFIRKLII